MAISYTPLTVQSGYNTNIINQNFSDIQGALQDALSLSNALAPNQAEADFDMNSNKIINLATPTANQDAVTKLYVDDRTVTAGEIAQVAADAATASAAAAAASASESNAATSETNAAASAASALVNEMDWQGAYSGATTYADNDVVSLNGASYISQQDSNLNNTPVVSTDTAFWHVVAERGIDGSNGTGAVDSVSAGTGLTGSGTGSDPILALTVPVTVALGGSGAITAAAARTNFGLGTAAVLNTGTSSGDIPLLDGSGLPAVSGVNVTDVVHPAATVNLTTGYTTTAEDYGTITTGTLTVDFTDSAQAYYTNNGAHALGVPSQAGGQDIIITNGASASIPTTVGWILKGDPLTATNTEQFLVNLRIINSVAVMAVVALQ